MNENRVLKVEKRMSFKFVFVILILVVLGGIGYGTYYLIKNKDNLDFYLPWEKNDDSETREVKGLKSNKDDNVKRTETTIETPVKINNSSLYEVKLDSMKYENENYIFNFKIIDNDIVDYSIEITDILLDDFSTRITKTIEVSGFSSTSFDFTITKELLDRYRIDTFGTIHLRAIVTDKDTKAKDDVDWSIRSNNIASYLPRVIQEVLEVDGIKVYYYKAVESKDNYFIYILLENTSGKDIDYYYSKFVLGEKEFDASSYAGRINSDTKYVDMIKIPKKDFRKLSTLWLRMMTIYNDDIKLSKEVKVVL